MAILEILTYPDPRLKKVSAEVKKVTPELQKLADDMLETMYEAPGVGLAAAQVGHNIRLIVVDTQPKDDNGNPDLEEMSELEKIAPFPLILFNPKVVSREGKITWEEGCLSVPTFIETVERAGHIVVEALDRNGQAIRFEADGLLSVCIQHEIDHLDGKLFIERISYIKMTQIKNKIKKHGYPERDENDDNGKGNRGL